ncbi:uncharacterized protein LOC128962949 [Oppia nitens]|uniref:uncharacterized protein LOC128962949 n=1 Tax=Oppia nitens TaxID=1686743 RepID=UPI0023DC7FC3|nr:uncharacterized protein LOC128962949 [Oppia nitens]
MSSSLLAIIKIIVAIIAIILLVNGGYECRPFTYIIPSPYGTQIVSHGLGIDGSHFVASNGPGYAYNSYVSSSPNNDYHYNAMSSGTGFVAPGSNYFGGMNMGMGMGMGMGTGMMPMIKPMQPMKWWPSIFGNSHHSGGHEHQQEMGTGFKWWPSIFGNDD